MRPLQESRIASQLLGAVDWTSDDERSAPLLILIDIPEGGKHCVYKQGPEIQPGDVDELIDKYRDQENSSLPMKMLQ